jgi:hypothetical protein
MLQTNLAKLHQSVFQKSSEGEEPTLAQIAAKEVELFEYHLKHGHRVE